MTAKFIASFDDPIIELAQNQTNSRQRILSVEDEQDLRQLTPEVLIDAGYQVDVAEDGGSAADYVDANLNLLKVDGNLPLFRAREKPHAISAFFLIMGRRSLSGSPIGGIAETQEMLDLCAQHNITAVVEIFSIHKVNEAYDRMAKGDVKYRFSIDMVSLKPE